MSAAEVRRLGRYRIEELIGTGSFASVYRAFDDRLDAPVVVKLLGDNHGLNPEVRERFIGEARALRKIRNPHVIEAYDIGETEHHQPFLVLEYADRGTLAERIAALRARSIPVSPDDLAAVARSLGEAVGAVHGASIVHRDLSPSNVLLRSVPALPTRDGRVRPDGRPTEPTAVIAPDERLLVADLGMCKDLAINSGLTVAGGTDGFRPPEQRGRPGPIDPRADLWALSALMVWIASDRHPPSVDPVEAIDDAGLPRDLGVAFLRSLADDPTERHSDVDDWLADVVGALEPVDEPQLTTPVGEPVRPGRSARRGRSVLIAAASLVAGLAAGAGAATFIDGGGGSASEVRDLGGGDVEISTVADDATLALTGPETVDVGEVATFVAQTDGVDEWAWFMPDGSVLANVDDVTLRAASPGTAHLSLRAQHRSGEELEVTHRLTVVEVD